MVPDRAVRGPGCRSSVESVMRVVLVTLTHQLRQIIPLLLLILVEQRPAASIGLIDQCRSLVKLLVALVVEIVVDLVILRPLRIGEEIFNRLLARLLGRALALKEGVQLLSRVGPDRVHLFLLIGREVELFRNPGVIAVERAVLLMRRAMADAIGHAPDHHARAHHEYGGRDQYQVAVNHDSSTAAKNKRRSSINASNPSGWTHPPDTRPPPGMLSHPCSVSLPLS